MEEGFLPREMNNVQKLLAIAQEIERCRVCKEGTTGKAVPGEGGSYTKIVFVGEAPGKKEAATGRPFIGKSGQLLRQTMAEIGLDPKDVFITSVSKYLPLKGTPSMFQIAHGRIHLKKQLTVIQPKVVVLLGSIAVQGVLQVKIPIKAEHGRFIKKDNITYFITIHPAAALRFPALRRIFKEDFQLLKAFLQKNRLL